MLSKAVDQGYMLTTCPMRIQRLIFAGAKKPAKMLYSKCWGRDVDPDFDMLSPVYRVKTI